MQIFFLRLASIHGGALPQPVTYINNIPYSNRYEISISLCKKCKKKKTEAQIEQDISRLIEQIARLAIYGRSKLFRTAKRLL